MVGINLLAHCPIQHFLFGQCPRPDVNISEFTTVTGAIVTIIWTPSNKDIAQEIQWNSGDIDVGIFEVYRSFFAILEKNIIGTHMLLFVL